ncbi:DNA cytosine methyltransferase [Actinokineospora pegani]|uniref:DNA cytosine methyltransferase n=1 Tax=Actinokineospora pegani TaxID=2654637 RepID=UPI0012E9DF41|nr:DNA cytosine methyltransferase [Actinokineospora pegani]
MTPVIGSLCTGSGGLDMGVLTALGGGRIAWVADPDPHIRQLLAARLPGTPNLGDLRFVDWAAVDPVDVLVAGFPCQDISAAGKRAGIEKGTRSGLWTDIVAGVRLLRPALLIVENVAALRWRNGGLHRVLGDLAEAGYDALWRCVRACDIGAAHRRERVFLLAWPRHTRARRLAAPNAQGLRHRHTGQARGGGILATAVAASHPAGHPAKHTAAHTASDRRDEGLPGTARDQGRPDAALGGDPTAAAEPRHGIAAEVDWGDYRTAITRWERVLGRPVPYPTQPGAHGRPVLAPAFVEHLMGLPAGWVTDLPLPRTAQLRALGNGVVPQQAAHAVSLLLHDLNTLLHATATPSREANAA